MKIKVKNDFEGREVIVRLRAQQCTCQCQQQQQAEMCRMSIQCIHYEQHFNKGLFFCQIGRVIIKVEELKKGKNGE
ncbi:MAG: hypothetical protein K0U15_05130 [Proteobacteria bacterium]|nr:hypothetical protein [Pseudomonadota bacterium]